MNAFFQTLSSNAPVLLTLALLFVLLMWFAISMKSEFRILRTEMVEGFKSVRLEILHLDNKLDNKITMEVKGLRNEINDLRKDMEHGFKDLRKDMDQGFKDLRKDMEQQGKDIRAEMAQQGKDIRAEMAEQGKDIRTEMKEGFMKRDHEFEKTLTTLKISRNEDVKKEQQ